MAPRQQTSARIRLTSQVTALSIKRENESVGVGLEPISEKSSVLQIEKILINQM